MHGLTAWLMTGMTGQLHIPPPPLLAWHARLMVLGWTILIPSGVFIARFVKITAWQDWPNTLDSKLWWYSHRRLIDAALLAILAALALAWLGAGPGNRLMALHRWLGWVISGGLALQVLAGLFRGTKGGPTEATLRGDHYDMTPRRVAFEYLHKSLGWLLLMLAVGEVFLGLWMVNAPRWMAVVITLWWCVFLAVFVWAQRRGLCIDTYQAIWGPATEHPGNLRRRPIGWGVRRRTP
ncbi:cytochrome b561 domain-containing protein [Acidisoma sp. 7E03]